jgi:hypothetical protein
MPREDAERLIKEPSDEDANRIVGISRLLFPEIICAVQYWKEKRMALCAMKVKCVGGHVSVDDLQPSFKEFANADGELAERIIHLGLEVRSGGVVQWLNSLIA